MNEDLRVCFVGDSFVAGVGDPEHRGWVWRLAARTEAAGRSLVAYNLGIRRQTSHDVRQRWRSECQHRLAGDADGRVVVSFGVNDATWEQGTVRVSSDDSGANLDAVLGEAAALGWRALVVGPPPVADPDHKQRIADLDDVFHDVCRDNAVPYVTVFHQLASCDAWMEEVNRGDGAHPAATGYRRMSELIWPTWHAWVASQRPEDLDGAR